MSNSTVGRNLLGNLQTPAAVRRRPRAAASNFGKTVIVELRLFAGADYRKRLMWIFGDDWRPWRRLACTGRLIFTLLPRPPTNHIQTLSWTSLPWKYPRGYTPLLFLAIHLYFTITGSSKSINEKKT